MANVEKLIGKLRNARGEVRFSDVLKVAKHFGYKLDRVRGSHHIFVAEGRNHINIVVHRNKAKAIYVKLLFKEVGIE